MPYIASRPGMYEEIVKKAKEALGRHPTSFLLRRQVGVSLQPLPRIVGHTSEARGGNAMGLSAACPDRIILEFSCSYLYRRDDALMAKISAEVVGWVEEQVPLWSKEAGLPADLYMPHFMNDANDDQKVTSSYRDYDKLKRLQESVDPTGTFRYRAGGHKY